MILGSTKGYGLRQGNPCGLVAIDLAECVPGPWSAFRGMRQEKQLAWPPSRVELAESLFSPLFWILGGCVQHCFFLRLVDSEISS
jgi:hypothetical protein